MSFSPAKRLQRFPEYVHARMAKYVAEVEKSSGRKVKNFGIGSPDIPPSPLYVQKYAEFIRDPKAHLYPGYKGIVEFNDALAQWYKNRFGVELTHDEVLPLLGGKDACAHLPLALCDEGDEVLVPDPGYPGFAGPVLMIGAKPIYYDLLLENGFKISIAELEKKVTGKTKFIWVNFPSNPTGAIASLEELKEIVTFAKKHNVIIVYDNAYAEITFDNYVAPSILQIPDAKDICVELGSFSKTFSFAGYRMGWIVGNKDVIAALAKVKSQVDSGLSLPLQRLGAFALINQDKQWNKNMIKTYKERRDVIARKMQALGLTFELPKAALYIWAKIPDSAKDSESYALEILRSKQVLFAPGSAFGKNGNRYIRASICVNTNDIDEYL